MNRAVHGLVFVGGWLSFGLGLIGVVLPVLPTTPFMLLAATCFAKTSPRFHHWLLQSRLFGTLIRNWQEARYIESSAKTRALILVAITFSVSVYLVQYLWLKLVLVAFWLICSVILGRLPTRPQIERRQSSESTSETTAGQGRT